MKKQIHKSIPIEALKDAGMVYGYIKCDVCGNTFEPKFYDFKGEYTLKPEYIFENVSAGIFFMSCSSECKFDGAIQIQKGTFKNMRKITWR